MPVSTKEMSRSNAESVNGDECRNEYGRDTFQIAARFTDGHIPGKILLVNTLEQAQNIADIRL